MNLPVISASSLRQRGVEQPIRVWGIDLGTTNSTIAEITWSPTEGLTRLPECHCLEIDQPTPDGVYTSPLVPSVVAMLPSGGHWVGEGARRLRTRPQEASLDVEKTLFFETKNDMGLRKTYYRAEEPYNHASKIAGHILRFLTQEAEQVTGVTPDRIVVTVPASFQLNQRRDTLLAAQYAGLNLGDHDLLDEPTAALVDYLVTHPDEALVVPGQVVRGLVFDFGGGTCDVSIVEVQADEQAGQLKISPLAISRYHRLGGGDLDAAIVHEILIPELLKENGLSSHDVTWAEKKRGLEPQLLGTAEALKIALCMEIARRQGFGQYPPADGETVGSKQPPVTCQLRRQELTLSKPCLSAQQWEDMLIPFLDKDYLYARETEYRLTQSVFAPLQDSLDRANLSPKKIDFCLLVGGSTLIPQVRDAIRSYFEQAKVCAFPDWLSIQTAIARGAAWHAFYLAATGKPLVQPVASDSLALLTGKGDPYTLIQAGTSLPYPADGSYARVDNLEVPRTMIRELKLEVIALSTRQPLLAEIWSIPHLVNAGDAITLEYRLKATQEFDCRAYLAEHPDSPFEPPTAENPLRNVVTPNQVRLEIEKAEEELRQKGGGSAEDRDQFVLLAKWYAELSQYEKALEYLRTALRKVNRPDVDILHMQGMYYGDLMDYARQEKAYREADQAAGSWGGPMFNLSLSLRRQKRSGEALEAIDRALVKEPDSGPYLTQRGLCLRSLRRDTEALTEFQRAMEAFGSLRDLSDWELGWLLTCTREVSDEEAYQEAKAEQERRSIVVETPHPQPERPGVRGDMERRAS